MSPAGITFTPRESKFNLVIDHSVIIDQSRSGLVYTYLIERRGTWREEGMDSEPLSDELNGVRLLGTSSASASVTRWSPDQLSVLANTRAAATSDPFQQRLGKWSNSKSERARRAVPSAGACEFWPPSVSTTQAKVVARTDSARSNASGRAKVRSLASTA